MRFELTISGFADRRLNQLGYARVALELRAGIEPALSPWQGDVIPLDQRSPEDFESRILNFEFEVAIRNSQLDIRNSMVLAEGVEPSPNWV